MPNAVAYFAISCAVWIGILSIPPGPKTVAASYRLNFAQGVVCSLLAILALVGKLPESLAVMSCAAYFVVDTVNKVLNDHYFRVVSYQRGIVRVVEYIHHILSIVVCFYSHVYYQEVCSCSANPVLKIALAELSTPFLVAWRQTNYEWLGILFVVVFFAVRIAYQGFFLMPEIFSTCSSVLVSGFCALYVALNAWFMYMIIVKAFFSSKKEKRRDTSVRVDEVDDSSITYSTNGSYDQPIADSKKEE